jgi:hypothetical protein
MATAEDSVRVYRHRPWLVLNTLVAVFMGGWIVALIGYAVRAPSIETVAKVLLLLVPLGAFEAYLVLAFRIRTVVDGTGITQQWILRSYRMPYAEVTGLEPVHTYLRWYLRVHCGDRASR